MKSKKDGVKFLENCVLVTTATLIKYVANDSKVTFVETKLIH